MPTAMDIVQKQVLELSDKVDTLHCLLEELTVKVTDIASTQDRFYSGDVGPEIGAVNLPPVPIYRMADPSMMHKDVLSDESCFEGDKSSTPHNISPEIQIQRLTAQLTAAYNRMAALEEQILACRFQ